MLKPNGFKAQNIDSTMLLYQWALQLRKEKGPEMLFAGIGKPTYPLNEDVALAAMTYWQEKYIRISQLKRKVLDRGLDCLSDLFAEGKASIDYGLPGGTEEATAILSQVFTQWYEVPIQPKEIVFTVGASAALRIIFNVLHQKKPGRKIVTPSPCYAFYSNPAHRNRFHWINLLEEPNYRLTASFLEQQLITIDPQTISAFLFCDPNNPMGYMVGEGEWKKIARILQRTPKDIPIILDEAYAELSFTSHISLLKAAPELRERIILVRSGTKGFSASGERLAALVCFNDELRDGLLDESLFTYAHVPKSLQIAYAQGMLEFTEEKRLSLANFYRTQVELVQKRLKKLGIHLNNPQYKVEGAFYVIANLESLLGTPLPPAAARILEKEGNIETDEDLCYALLTEYRIMLCPLSYCGVNPNLGWVRITCSEGSSRLNELIDRLEDCLCQSKVPHYQIEQNPQKF